MEARRPTVQQRMETTRTLVRSEAGKVKRGVQMTRYRSREKERIVRTDV